MEPAEIAIFAFIIISSLTFHEAAHAAAATACGDELPRLQGRLTLNPLRHIDLFGTILLPIVLFALAGVGFGYAKPVQFRPEKFRSPRVDTFLVAMAGPAANIALAVIFFAFGLLFAFLSGGAHHVPEIVLLFFIIAIVANIVLAVFNLIPVPPLDGHYVLDLFLPERARQAVRSLGILGILVAWWLSRPILGFVLPPIQRFVLDAFAAV